MPSPYRALFILLCGLFGLGGQSAWSQHRIEHQLRYLPESQSLDGLTRIHWGQADSAALLHLAPRSLSWKSSFLNTQLAEFQNVKLYYATQQEAGDIRLEYLQVNGKAIEVCEDCELLPLAALDSGATLELRYRLRLPEANFNGVGWSKELVRVIDWLPRPARRDPENGRAYPVTYHFDSFFPLDSFALSLSLPPSWQAVSNLPRQRQEDSLWHFAGQARSLQFFLAPQFHYYPLGSGRQLILLEKDDYSHAITEISRRQVARFFAEELNDSLQDYHSLLLLPRKKGDYQSAGLLSLEMPKSVFELSRNLAEATAEAAFRYRVHPHGVETPWLARGIAYYYQYRFVKTVYPKERWVPFSTSLLGRLFALDDYDYSYQNRFLYLFLARQGLDQSLSAPADSLSRLNYQAIIQAKSYLALSHLRAYLGERDFKRGMARYYARFRGKSPGAPALQSSLAYYSAKELDWFFNQMLPAAAIYDYQLLSVDHCATVTVAKVAQRGDQKLPYSLTGYREGKPVLTEWYEGHAGQRSVQMYHEDYDKVVLNDHLSHFEYRQKNNTWFNRPLLQRAERPRFQFYNSFENPEASQIFYLPAASYNAYDQILLGATFSNRSYLVQKPFEYSLSPSYSTGTGRLTGGASAVYNYTTPKSHFFRQLSFGLFGRYLHYDRDLAFARLSPAVNFRIRKPYPRSPLIQNLRFRAVMVERELPPNFSGDNTSLDAASYRVFNLSYRLENTDIFKPVIARANLELAGDFGKVYAEYDQRWMLPNRRWLIWRNFAGVFLYNRPADRGLRDNYYSFGLSGTQDYLFDYYLIGRSDQSGIWSQQMFVTDGGFKSQTRAFADRFLLTSNLNVPLYSFFGVFGDIGLSEERLYYDYGLRLSFLTDFLELYLPVANQDQQFWQEQGYFQHARFILDLDLNNIINRLRRGFY